LFKNTSVEIIFNSQGLELCKKDDGFPCIALVNIKPSLKTPVVFCEKKL